MQSTVAGNFVRTAYPALFLALGLLAQLAASGESANSVKHSEIQTATKTEAANPVSTSVAAESRQHRPRLALVLGGGGTRGAAHVGVLKVLENNGIKPDMIVATSMGAVIGGLYSAGVSLDAIAAKFDDGKLMRSFMTVPLYVRIGAAPVLVLPRAFGYHPYDGLYRGNKFRKYLNRSLPQCEQNIEGLKMKFAAVALNLVDGQPYALTEGRLGYAMQASSAVPGLRKPVQIDDKLYVDGGVAANVPVEQARKMGADIVIAVDVDEPFTEVPLKTFRKIGSVSRRIVQLQLATNDALQLKNADIVIHPDVGGIGLISTKKKDARHAMDAGEKAALAALPAIQARLVKAGLALTPYATSD